MLNRLSDYQEQYGDLYNLEATPAESTAFRLAKHDVKRYPDIITAAQAGGTPYYTNSSHLPVSFTDDMFTALDIQDKLQTKYTSGTVFHAFLGEKLPDWQAAAALVRKIAENYALPYYTLSPTYSVCQKHGYIAGEHFTCDKCGEPAEVYSRITGYYRPVQNWNAGKTQEFKERKEYVLAADALSDQPMKQTETEQAMPDAQNGELSLFISQTCPNCRAAMMLLDKAGIPYSTLDAVENKELALRYAIKQAPTLVDVSGDNIQRHVGVADIKRFLRSQAVKA
jgi:glutaredoxin